MKLSVSKTAECLNIPLSKIERWIRQGRIPIKKSGSTIYFDRIILEEWAKSRNLQFSPPTEESDRRVSAAPETLHSSILRGGGLHIFAASDVNGAIRSAVDIMQVADHTKPDIYEKLIEREEMSSTGIGKGVAIPHPRGPLEEGPFQAVITACLLDTPIDFSAVDDKPVFAMFVLLCPDIKIHLHLLSRLSFCIRDDRFIQFLKNRPQTEAFLSEIKSFESRLDS